MPQFRICSVIALMLLCHWAQSQDRVYDRIFMSDGMVLQGKVFDISKTQIRYSATGGLSGKMYYLQKEDVDSIVLANGIVEVFEHIKEITAPTLNTWTYDLAGFAFLSFSQSYERRTKDEKIGFRIPLYLGFIGGGFAGIGTFKPKIGIYYPYNYYYNNMGSGYRTCVATGINLKYYLFKGKVVRIFLGPEVTMGYTRNANLYYDGKGNVYNQQNNSITFGTCAFLGKIGLSIYTNGKFNLTIEGGPGLGDIFGHNKASPSPVGFSGLWQFGFLLGTNF